LTSGKIRYNIVEHSNNGCCMAVEDKVRRASELLEEAYEESECKWCARNLQKLAKITDQMADIAPYTAETAKKVSSKTTEEIQMVGGKVRVLHDVVVAAQRENGNITDVSKQFNTAHEHNSGRGLSMDKHRATLIIGGSVAIGTGVGFALNRVDEMVSVGKPWYAKVGPAANVLGGLALAILGMTGKITKKEATQTMLVAGGAAMMSNGALQYLEGMYTQFKPTARPAGRGFVNARAPGQMPVRLVDDVKSF
jgi:hypothetical protein